MARDIINTAGTATGSGLKQQADRTISEKSDGQLEGTVQWIGDSSLLGSADEVGDAHPDDARLEMFQRDIVYNALGQVVITGQYIGLKEDPTDPVASYSGGSGQESITVHPQFRFFAGDLNETTDTEDWYLTAGTGDEEGYLIGRHGARFDANTKEFVGFVDPTDTKAGMTSYLKTGDQVAVTYWATDVPDFAKRNRIFSSFPYAGITVNDEVVNWLLVDMPITQVGLLYQVTEVYLGSDDSEGWDSDVYAANGAASKNRTTDQTT